MKKNSSMKTLVLLCLAIPTPVRGELTIGFVTGLTSLKSHPPKDLITAQKLQEYQKYLKGLMESDYLVDEADFISQSSLEAAIADDNDNERAGFGTFQGGARVFDSVNRKVNAKLDEISKAIRDIFSNNLYDIEGSLRFAAIDEDCDGMGYYKMQISAMTITSKINSTMHIYLPKSNGKEEQISPESFYDELSISKRIIRALEPDYVSILGKCDSYAHPRTQTRSGLTIGVSIAYSYTFFYDEKIKYGIYTGVEAFGEVTPKAMKSHGFKVKEKEVGLRPFLGVECRDSWRIFILGGLKLRQLDTKYFALHQRKTKPAFEIGIGSEYLLSEKYSIGLKLIKTMKQRHKMKYNTKFTTTSLKILFSFGMRF